MAPRQSFQPPSIASEIRRLRVASGLTGQELAQLVGLSQPRVSRIENGRMTPSEQEIEVIAQALHVSEEDRDRLLELRRSAAPASLKIPKMVTTGQFDAVQRQWYALERASHRVWVFHHSVIPGLLQVEEYARVVMEGINFNNDNSVNHALAVLMHRQSLLFDDSRRFRFLISESALKKDMGLPKAVVSAQLRLLDQLSRRANLEIRCVSSSKLNGAAKDDFHIFAVGKSPLVVVETLMTDLRLDHRHHVAVYQSLFEELWEKAERLRPSDSLEQEPQTP